MSTGYERNELSSAFHRSRHRLIEREIKRHTLAAFSPSSLAGGSSVGMMWKLKHTDITFKTLEKNSFTHHVTGKYSSICCNQAAAMG